MKIFSNIYKSGHFILLFHLILKSILILYLYLSNFIRHSETDFNIANVHFLLTQYRFEILPAFGEIFDFLKLRIFFTIEFFCAFFH